MSRKHRKTIRNRYELIEWYGEDPYEYYGYSKNDSTTKVEQDPIPKFRICPTKILENN